MSKKQDPYICCLQETHFSSKDSQIESEGIKKVTSCKLKPKKAVVAILTLDKINFKTRLQQEKKDIT